MPDNRQLRLMAQMVLYELEQGLGSLVANNPPDEATGPIPRVLERIPTIQDPGRTDRIGEVIAASYLGELIDMTLASKADSAPQLAAAKRLKDLVAAFDLMQIRNACAHPNREFLECYWHRLAALATDPCLEVLGLRKVHAAYQAALEGQIRELPEHWLKAPVWSLPNNLPPFFEHSVTGLVGRKKETYDLLKQLSHPRAMPLAIVAPGGFGKTSLLLDVLAAVVKLPGSLEWVDRVVFVSSKTHRLTRAGLDEIEGALATLGAVQSGIAAALQEDLTESFGYEQACQRFKDQRVLLCLDNLDAVLRDESSAFKQFHENLPVKWRFVATSRVTIDGAITYPLHPMSPEGLRGLAHAYARSQGARPLEEGLLDQVVTACRGNPLAIKLCVDFHTAGGDLHESLDAATLSVADFAYAGLAAALPPLATEILELLYVSAEPLTRTQLGSILDRHGDDVFDAMTTLLKTSLLYRDPTAEEDLYQLQPSVRDLMREQPVNLKAREDAALNLRRSLERSEQVRRQQERTGQTKLSVGYIPAATPAEVTSACDEVLRLTRRRNLDRRALRLSLRPLERTLEREPTLLVARRVLALGYFALDDYPTAIEVLREGVDPALLRSDQELPDPALVLQLAGYAREQGDGKTALLCAEALVRRGWADPSRSSPQKAEKVMLAYHLPRVWRGEADAVVSDTAHWRTQPLSRLLGVIHAAALRNRCELEYEIDFPKVVADLLEAARTLDEVIQAHGYAVDAVIESMKLIRQFAYVARDARKLTPNAIRAIATFVSKHLRACCHIHRDYSLESEEVTAWLTVLRALPGDSETNALKRDLKFDESNSAGQTAEEAAAVLATVVKPPLVDGVCRTYLFARDSDGRSYYVSRGRIEKLPCEWDEIAVGDPIRIVPARESGGGPAWPAQRAWLDDEGPRAEDPDTVRTETQDEDTVYLPCSACGESMSVRPGPNPKPTMHVTCDRCGAHIPVHRSHDGRFFTGKSDASNTMPTRQTDQRLSKRAEEYARTLRRLTVRLIPAELWRPALLVMAEAFRERPNRTFSSFPELEETLTDAMLKFDPRFDLQHARKVRTMVFKAHVFAVAPDRSWIALKPEFLEDPQRLANAVDQELMSRLVDQHGPQLDEKAVAELLNPELVTQSAPHYRRMLERINDWRQDS